MSRKDRIIDEIKSITQKIKRNKDKGYSIENLQKALNRLESEAREKGVKVKMYALGA